ncbi:MAG: NAD+ synthase [Chloroflexi bacterium]|jgi:NAD+ synthase (glutamine-hydrolysing)|nr:NAD+ synthase [Chloroflexota bacterium]
MRVTLAQLNPIVGDIPGNARRIADVLSDTAGESPDLVVFPELYLVGYPPKDLLEREWFIQRVLRALDELRQVSRRYPETGILLGAPLPADTPNGKGLRNSAVLLAGSEIVATRYKSLLPTYDVFDEARYFNPASEVQVVPFKGEKLGIHICEDAWADSQLWPRRSLYPCDPVAMLAAQGATLFINLSASPFSVGKESIRYQLVRRHVVRHRAPFIYVNQIGANDDLIFDGHSIALDAQGEPVAVLPPFQEQVQTIDTDTPGTPGAHVPQEEIASVHDALVLGIRDYMHKCGFRQAVIGLSGGIDSAVTCYLAAAALGAANVWGVSMPSPYSSRGSVEDSCQLAASLGCRFSVIPISDTFQAYLDTLAEPFAGTQPNVAEENIQARIRGNILMALSNKFGHIVLSTGNKSEIAVGYTTLYGDMIGGLMVLSDVPKTMVYELARYINREREIIPRATIEKPPSAELKPNQLDQDTLPPYPILDDILRYYVEEGYSAEEIIALGHAEQTVRWVVRAVDRNEYKRKQAAPGLRITTKAFGVGWRMPIAARY